jgi:acetyl-CoA carboxylase, biotin carboxylase subunit
MNTRVQVEHPVTEMITGVDIVKEQILHRRRRAACATAGRHQIRGHAIECRINAEDRRPSCPARAITSSTRRAGPASARDAHLHGYTVPPYYDSMIGKLITHGEDPRHGHRAHAHALPRS